MATLDKLTTILDFRTDLSSLRQAEAASNRARGRLEGLSTSADRTRGSIGGMATAFRGLGPVLGAVGAGLVAHRLKEYADQWTLIRNRVALYTDSAAETEKVQQRLFNIAQQTRSSLEATGTLYQRVAMANDSLGVSQDRLLNFTETLGQAFIVSGASAQEARNAIIQFGQGLASGELRGEEYRSITEQGVRVVQALASSLRVTRGELREMAHEGKLTSDVVFKAIEQDAGNIRQEFEKLTPTIGQSFTVLGNSLTAAVGKFSEATGAANFFAQAITGIAGAIDAVTESGRRQDDQLTAAQGRQQNRARRRQVIAQEALEARRPRPVPASPPPNLTPHQRRQWLRGRGRELGLPGGFADPGETTSPRDFREFTTTGGLTLEGFGGAGFGDRQNLLGLDMTPTQTAADIDAGRDYLQKVLEASATGPGLDSAGFTGMQQSLFGLGEAFQGLGNVTDDVGVQLRAEEAAKKDGIKTGREHLEGLVKQAPVLTTLRANILGLNVDADRTGISIGLAGTKSERWSQGLANLGGALADAVARTNRFAGAALSIVQGAATGGPLGALAAGISSLIPIFGSSARSARAVSAALKEKLILEREELRGKQASLLLRARLTASPEEESAEQATFFSSLAEFIQGVDAPNLFGDYGALQQVIETLQAFDKYNVDELSDLDAQGPNDPHGVAGPLGRALFPLLEGFRNLFGPDVKWVEIIEEFLSSDVFKNFFGSDVDPTTLAEPLQAGPATTPYQQAVAEGRAGDFGPAPIHVTVQQLTVDIDAAGADPDAIGDMFDRRFRGQLRAVAEAVDTQIKA